jgi:hypothetical protein
MVHLHNLKIKVSTYVNGRNHMCQEVQKILVQSMKAPEKEKTNRPSIFSRLLADGKRETMKCVHQSATRY